MPARLHLASLLIRDALPDVPEVQRKDLSDLAQQLDAQSTVAVAKLGERSRFARYDKHLMERIVEISRGMEGDEIYMNTVRRKQFL